MNGSTAPEAPGSSAASPHAELERVYREHFAFAWRSLHRLGVPEGDLPDAVHDVFLVVARKLPEFDRSARLTTWLYAVCFRHASERRRRAHLRREIHVEVEAVDPGSSPARAADLNQQRRVLDAILDAMPLEQRAVFTLFELEGYRGEQIAELMQTPLATVHSRLRLARQAFRKSVERAKLREGFALRRSGVTP